jgi:acetyltransferase-like isoleucine patch superfamily enzyme
LERDVMLSANALIVDHLHAYEDVSRPIREQGVTEGGRIRIGQGCWIGHGAAIVCDRGELELGRNCVVAANAVVTKSFPAYSVIAGNPARVVRQFDAARKNWVLGVARPAMAPPDLVEALR